MRSSTITSGAFVVKDENALIGTIAAVKTDDEIKAAEIGYCIGKTGGTRAIRAKHSVP